MFHYFTLLVNELQLLVRGRRGVCLVRANYFECLQPGQILGGIGTGESKAKIKF